MVVCLLQATFRMRVDLDAKADKIKSLELALERVDHSQKQAKRAEDEKRG